MIETLATFLVRHNRICAVFSILAVILCSLGITKISFIGDFSTFYEDGNPHQINIDRIKQQFSDADQIVLLLHNKDQAAESNFLARKGLLSLRQLTYQGWTLPFVSRVDSLTNHQRTQVDGDRFQVADLVTATTDLSDREISDIRHYIVQQPELINRFISKDGNTSAISFSLILPEQNYSTKAAAITAIQQLANDFSAQNPEYSIHLVGEPLLENALIDITIEEGKILFSLIGVYCFFALVVLLRTPVTVMASTTLIVLAIAMSIGLAGWLGFDLDPVSALTPNMVLMLAMADAIHLLTQYIVYLRQGMSKHDAMQHSLTVNIAPMFLTSVTTAVGFLGMNFAGSPTFRDFGNITAMGVLVAYVLSITLLPAITLALPMKPVPQKPLMLSSLMDKLAQLSIRHSRLILVIGVAITVGSGLFISRNSLNDNLIDYFDQGLTIRDDVDFASEHLSGFQTLQFYFESHQQDGINQPQFLQQVDAFTDWLRSQPEVSQVVSYSDTVKNINRAMHDDDPDWEKVPASRELASQYLLLYEMSLQLGQDLSQQLTFDKSGLIVSASLQKLNNVQLIALQKRSDQWLADHSIGSNTVASSRSLLFAHLGQQVIISMLTGSLIVLALMTLILCIGLKSIKYGLLSLIPNIMPAIIVYGLWGLLIKEINMAAAVTFTISLGIVVDDTVHFLTKYLKSIRSGHSPQQAIHSAFRIAGTALTTTTLVLAGSFMILGQSSFGINSSIAMMMVPILLIALILDFLFLPALLLKLKLAAS